VRAKVLSVEPARGRAFLSIKASQPNPLLQTLESVFASDSKEGKDEDLRPSLGDLSAAAELAAVLAASGAGVASAEVGPRRRTRGSSQAVELYFERSNPGGQGSGFQSAEQNLHRLFVRSEIYVQEVIVTTVPGLLDGEGLRRLAAALLIEVAEGRAEV
jgi:hypothetical protein